MVWNPRACSRPGTLALEGHCPGLPGGGAGALGGPLDRGRKSSSPHLCRFPHLPCLAPSTEPPELGVPVSGRRRKPFCPIGKYFLSLVTFWRPQFRSILLVLKLLRVGNAEEKKLDSRGRREVGGEAFHSLRLPTVVRN